MTMAKDKRAILVYADWISIFEKLEDVEAGKLIKHFFRYINDQNPEAPDRLTDIIFEPIKQQLKRDLKRYKAICLKNRDNINIRWNKDNTTEYDRIQSDTKHTDKDTDKDKDKDTDKEKETKKRKEFIPPTLEEVKQYFTENNYSEEGAEKAYYHYALADWFDARGHKVANWKSKMHTNWFTAEYSTLKKLAV